MYIDNLAKQQKEADRIDRNMDMQLEANDTKPVRPQSPVPKGDDLMADIQALLNDAGISPGEARYAKLLMALNSYVTRRDAKIYNFTFQLAKAEMREAGDGQA